MYLPKLWVLEKCSTVVSHTTTSYNYTWCSKGNKKWPTISSNTWKFRLHKNRREGFPGGSVVKKPLTNAGDKSSIPVPGRFHMPWSN